MKFLSDENQSFGIKDVLHVIGNTMLCLCAFFGFNYFFNGNMLISMVLSIIFWIANYFLIEKLVDAKTKNSRGGWSTTEIILFPIHITLFLIAAWFALHFINTEFVLKNEIKTKGINKIEEINTLSNEFKSQYTSEIDNEKTKYLSELKSYINTNGKSKPKDATLIDYNNLDIKDAKQIVESKINNNYIARKKSFENIYEEVSSKNKEILDKNDIIFRSWKKTLLSFAFLELDNLMTENINIYKNSLQSFDYKIKETETKIPFNSPYLLIKELKPNLWIGVVLLLIAFLFIDSPYLFLKNQNTIGTYKPGGFKGI